MYDYSKLKGKIVEVYGTQSNFAQALGIQKGTLSQKLRGFNRFSQDEIFKSIEILSIENPTPYFFTKKVG